MSSSSRNMHIAALSIEASAPLRVTLGVVAVLTLHESDNAAFRKAPPRSHPSGGLAVCLVPFASRTSLPDGSLVSGAPPEEVALVLISAAFNESADIRRSQMSDSTAYPSARSLARRSISLTRSCASLIQRFHKLSSTLLRDASAWPAFSSHFFCTPTRMASISSIRFSGVHWAVNVQFVALPCVTAAMVCASGPALDRSFTASSNQAATQSGQGRHICAS
mmetsp:Transcript_88317/g.142894  ORF Transcript_88317/g.142894 Transcript_88317/m.142894 type:complete len:221 (+) Transcript_88317:1571-2233(+)